MYKFLNSRSILLLGALLFFAVKAGFILVQTTAMGMPRLGDDSFVHLWRAEQVSHVGVLGTVTGKADTGSRAVRDIIALCDEASHEPAGRFQSYCARVADNTTVPDIKAGASVMLNLFLRLGLPLKWTYAINETVIAGIIAGGLAVFLLRLFGAAPAGLALVFMAFLNLPPPQGLGQFIPSTLVIGVSAGLIGVAATTASLRGYAVIAATFAALALVHPVAIVFGGALGPLALFSFPQLRKPRTLAVAGLIIAALLIAVLSVSSAVRNTMLEVVGMNFVTNLSNNVQALPKQLGSFAILNWAIVAAFVISLIRFRAVDRKIVAVGTAILCLLVVSLIHKTTFFLFNIDLDLFARVFVIFAALCCGWLAKVIIDDGWRPSLRRQLAIVALSVALTIPSLLNFLSAALANMNGRPEVIDSGRLHAVIAGLDPTATLAYGELDLAPNAAFLSGADRLGAIPLAGLAPRQLEQVLSDRKPKYLVLPNFRHLNVLSRIGSSSLETRRHGLPGSAVDIVAVSGEGAGINSLYLNLENDGDVPATISQIAYLSSHSPQRAGPAITVAPGERKWFAIDIGMLNAAQRVILRLPPSRLWLRGIAVNAPAPSGVYWPWDARAAVLWHIRGAPESQVGGAKFVPQLLLRHWNTPTAGDARLLSSARVVNDETGLVFLTTDYERSR